MRELIVAEFITLDGVIQAPGGTDEDTRAALSTAAGRCRSGTTTSAPTSSRPMSKADAFLLGRKTWQIHGGAFEPMPRRSVRRFAERHPQVRRFHHAESASAWRNSTLIRDNVVDAIRRLKQQPGKNILLDGSSVLAQTLAQNDLVDEYSLHVYPIVLGGGKRLFPEGKRLDLNLVEASPLPTGVVFMRYRRAG